MTSVDPLTLAPMSASDTDLDGALSLSAVLRWPYRKEDWRVALDLGHGTLVRSGEEIVASGLWWPYGANFATCGMIIVSPEMQGRGIGKQLMARLLAEMEDRSILLNATEEGLPLYRKLGFETVGSVHQHQAATKAADGANITVERDVRSGSVRDLDAIRDLDRQASGVDRDRLIAKFADFGEIAIIDGMDEPEGFAFCRPFGFGFAIGPVIARDPIAARALIAHFLRSHAGQFLRVDITGDSALGAWLADAGLPEVGHVTTMVKGVRPERPGPCRIYALASQSLG